MRLREVESFEELDLLFREVDSCEELNLLLDEVKSWKEKLDCCSLTHRGPARAGATRKRYQTGYSRC